MQGDMRTDNLAQIIAVQHELDGKPGGYVTIMSRNTVGKPCPSCGHEAHQPGKLGVVGHGTYVRQVLGLIGQSSASAVF